MLFVFFLQMIIASLTFFRLLHRRETKKGAAQCRLEGGNSAAILTLNDTALKCFISCKSLAVTNWKPQSTLFVLLKIYLFLATLFFSFTATC
jgi:hypothetical protein